VNHATEPSPIPASAPKPRYVSPRDEGVSHCPPRNDDTPGRYSLIRRCVHVKRAHSRTTFSGLPTTFDLVSNEIPQICLRTQDETLRRWSRSQDMYLSRRDFYMHALVLERCYNCDIIEAMPYPNKSKKDPITEWAVGQPLVMQTEQETTRKTKLGLPPTVSRVKKTLPAKQRTGMRKKTAVSKHQPKNKRNSP
jgi:hypothetical protein